MSMLLVFAADPLAFFGSSPVMTFDMKVGSPRARSSFWSGVRSLGTNVAAMRCMFKPDVMIGYTVPNDSATMVSRSLMDSDNHRTQVAELFPHFRGLSSSNVAQTFWRHPAMFCSS